MNSKIFDNICKKLSENKEIKESILNIKKYIDSSFIFLYIVFFFVIGSVRAEFYTFLFVGSVSCV